VQSLARTVAESRKRGCLIRGLLYSHPSLQLASRRKLHSESNRQGCWAPDRIHRFTQQLLVGDVIGGSGVACALDDFAPKAIDFVGRHLAKVLIQSVAGFELLAVNQQGVRTRERISGDIIEVSEQRQSSIFKAIGPVVVYPA